MSLLLNANKSARMLPPIRPLGIALFLLIFLQDCDAISVILKPEQTRCLWELFEKNELVFGQYEFSSLPDGSRLEIVIKDDEGHTVMKRDDVTVGARFAFTTNMAMKHCFCITLISSGGLQVGAANAEVKLDFLGASDGRIYELDDSELNKLDYAFDRVQALTEAMIQDFANMKRRSREMRDTNESTSRRVFYSAITSLIALLALTIWQIVYMRFFFKARKLIY